MNDVRSKLRELFARTFRNRQIADDENIFAAGYVNSMFAMELVLFVESQFDITVDNEDLEVQNFCSIDAISSLVDRKLTASQTG